jgi:hypothetical protein
MYRRSYQRRQYANGNVQRVRSKGKKSQRAYWKDIRWKEKKVDRNEWTEGAGTLPARWRYKYFFNRVEGPPYSAEATHFRWPRFLEGH